jgi:formate dehydrogenase gamma subunit
LACHSDADLEKLVEGKQISLHVDEKKFEASVHSFASCTDCHSEVKDYPHDPTPKKVSCAECHADAVSAYGRGLHAKAIKNGHIKAAGCGDCHGNAHEILASSDPQSKTYRTSIPQTCGSCHSMKFVMEGTGISAQSFFSYQESVHGRAVAAGSTKAAVCTDCHRSHDILSPADPKSPIFKFNVPATCGQCHQPITTEFDHSVHGQAIHRGNWQAPVCSDCHGIHLIKPHIDPSSSVASQAMARTACGRCHEGVRLSQEFGVAAGRVTSYLDSYHGLASRLGSTVAANCASCHGIHNILASTDPRSTIHKTNLVATCGKCHPGASENFARGSVHVGVPFSADTGTIVSEWVRKLYVWLIVLLIGFMLAHNGLVWRKKAVALRQKQERSVVRMTTGQRLQHLILLTSFITLVLTGFALKYPDSWLAWLLGSSESFRRIGHRVAGVALIGVGVYHLVYLFSTRDGWRLLKDIRPVRKDIYELLDSLRYYLGRSGKKPKFGRFGYPEKLEYWALVWGTIIMAITGLMAWFTLQTTTLLPRWSIDVALTIHFYEAILATLAILVWHFYQVVFDPDVYPMNWAWYDGRVSAEWYEEEHPLDVHRVEPTEGEGPQPPPEQSPAPASDPPPSGGPQHPLSGDA